jgi:hypothetical protein
MPIENQTPLVCWKAFGVACGVRVSRRAALEVGALESSLSYGGVRACV